MHKSLLNILIRVEESKHEWRRWTVAELTSAQSAKNMHMGH